MRALVLDDGATRLALAVCDNINRGWYLWDDQVRMNPPAGSGSRVTHRLSSVASANNVLNVPQTLLRYGDETPYYARQNRTSEFGIALALGIKGSF